FATCPSAARRPLAPSPTRRSSDLVGLVGHLDAGSVVAALTKRLVHGQHAFQQLGALVGVERLVLAGCPGEIPAMEEHVACVDRVDRKSTRLNSSHVKISYAVFCLT